MSSQSVQLRELLFDYENKSVNKLIYKIDSTTNIFTQNLYLFNINCVIPLHKYWIHIPRCKLVNVKNNIITIGFSDSTTNNKLYDFIKNITQLINDKILPHYKSTQINNKIHTNANIYFNIDFNFTNDTKLYNIDKEPISISTLKLSDGFDNYTIFVELDKIQIYNSAANFHWKILQMKELFVIDVNKSLFDMFDYETFHRVNLNNIIPNGLNVPNAPAIPNSAIPNSGILNPAIPNPNIFNPPNAPPIPVPIFNPPQLNQNNYVPNLNPNPKPSQNQNSSPFIPSPNDLVNMLSKLKKNNYVKQNLQETNTKQEVITLKKVETKEPKTVKQIYDEGLEMDKTNRIYKLIQNNIQMFKSFKNIQNRVRLNILKQFDEINAYSIT